jgi:hypothetical protein
MERKAFPFYRYALVGNEYRTAISKTVHPMRLGFYLALRSIRSTFFIFGLASGDTFTQPRATLRTASI